MIPVLHLSTVLSALFCVFAGKRLYFYWRTAKDQNVGDFLRAYISLGVYFIIVSLPALFSDPAKIQIIYAFSYVPVVLSAAFLARAAFRMLGYPAWSNYFSSIIYSFVSIVVILNIVFSRPATLRVYGELFYHWAEGTPLFLAIFNGVLLGILTTGCALLFLLGGIRGKEKLVRVRAFLIGAGLSLLVIAASFNYIFTLYMRGISQWLFPLLASFFALSGLILMLCGVYYRVDKY